jgi:hypothetical protein
MKVRNRILYASFFLTIILTIGFTSNVIALNYTIGFNANEDLIWNCHVCDIDKMNNIFGENWSSTGLFENLSQGKSMRWQITTVEENLTSLLANVNIWMWNNEEDWGFFDYNAEFSHLKDPSQYASNYNLSLVIPFIPFWLPVPVSDYLGTLKLSNMYDVDNRVLPTLNVQVNKDFLQPNNPSERMSMIAIYNTDGILSSFKLYTSGNVVVIDIEFGTIPLFVLPSTLGLIGAFFIAVILYIKKQRKNSTVNPD